MNKEKLVGPKELADILNVPLSWVYQRTCKGRDAFPFLKAGKYVRFDPQEVIEFLKKNNVK